MNLLFVFYKTLSNSNTSIGLPISTYFSLSKLVYFLNHIPKLSKDIESGEALFGTINTFLIWKLTQGYCPFFQRLKSTLLTRIQIIKIGKTHATDVTNASRTMLMNLLSLDWDIEILETFNIPIKCLPVIRPSSYVFGTMRCFQVRKYDYCNDVVIVLNVLIGR